MFLRMRPDPAPPALFHFNEIRPHIQKKGGSIFPVYSSQTPQAFSLKAEKLRHGRDFGN
jgi:hypothetical protein